jgi:hypothetical protein
MKIYHHLSVIFSFILKRINHSEFLNATFVDWEDAKYLTESMSFMLEDVSVILNKENTETTELYYEQNLHSLLAHYNHITPTWDNMLFLLDNSVSIAGDTFCEWLNIHYSLLPDETLPYDRRSAFTITYKTVSSQSSVKQRLSWSLKHSGYLLFNYLITY